MTFRHRRLWGGQRPRTGTRTPPVTEHIGRLIIAADLARQSAA